MALGAEATGQKCDVSRRQRTPCGQALRACSVKDDGRGLDGFLDEGRIELYQVRVWLNLDASSLEHRLGVIAQNFHPNFAENAQGRMMDHFDLIGG